VPLDEHVLERDGRRSGGRSTEPARQAGRVDYIKREFYSGEIAGQDVRVVQYTAGTTGRPKGALLTGEGLLTVAPRACRVVAVAGRRRRLHPNPMTHIIGLVLGVLMPGNILAVPKPRDSRD
jgi:acyl-CoA synthetase (AMP-forming)/AMP-acid ligase II